MAVVTNALKMALLVVLALAAGSASAQRPARDRAEAAVHSALATLEREGRTVDAERTLVLVSATSWSSGRASRDQSQVLGDTDGLVEGRKYWLVEFVTRAEPDVELDADAHGNLVNATAEAEPRTMVYVDPAALPDAPTVNIGVGVGVRCADPDIVEVVLHNPSAGPVVLAEWRLPWSVNSESVEFETWQLADGRATQLEAGAIIADRFSDPYVVIPAGGSLRGDVIVQHGYFEREEARATGDLLVLYRVNPRQSATTTRFVGKSGAIVIPQRGLFGQDCPTIVRSGH